MGSPAPAGRVTDVMIDRGEVGGGVGRVGVRVAGMCTHALIEGVGAPAAFGPLLSARPRVRRPALAGRDATRA